MSHLKVLLYCLEGEARPATEAGVLVHLVMARGCLPRVETVRKREREREREKEGERERGREQFSGGKIWTF